MLQAVNVSLQFGKRVLFDNVNIKFTKGNCYGIIGANGAGKSTFLKILSGEIEPNKGEVILDRRERLSVLCQNQNAFDESTVLETVLLGHKRLVEIMREKDELYAKENFTDADGIRAGELEEEFSELNGWEAEPNAKILLTGVGVSEDLFDTLMGDLDYKVKVKVLLVQALFANPDVLILDEPTNNLDFKSVKWLENFLLDYENTVIVVSHNRHFLNKVCTHICDIDYNKISVTIGNYDFWYETNQLLIRQAKEANKKMQARIDELKEFIQRFSANASKSKQATSRKKELDKITLEDIKPSTRKYPYIDFKFEREIGNEILFVENLSKEGFFKNLSFTVKKDDKIAFVSSNSLAISALFDILCGVIEPDEGEFTFGKTVSVGYIPQDYRHFFEGNDLNLVEWLRQYSREKDETFVRGWLGRMLFSGEEALKKVSVLSGGERVRCMMSKAMLEGGNFLIMDEPTNHLDLEAITSLNKALINYKSCLLFTTHDQEILNTVANRIIEVGTGRSFDKYINFEEYLELYGDVIK